ncbi:putative disease resistance RPP13-like protein 1 [Corylus avellana]|uniref:putative disease resistance RPP13-like protein 1 n=1 Tax=Corylus avellana TaxID=13451 RepID=UPI00286BADA8|nr:putative disease resistance RPP13-like protein 1 [Corylus avellana]
MASREFADIFQGRKLNERLLHKLKIALLSVNALVEDAEEKQLTKPAVKEWLEESKDAVYEAEDVLDEIATEALKRKLDAEFQTTSSHRAKDSRATWQTRISSNAKRCSRSKRRCWRRIIKKIPHDFFGRRIWYFW